MSFPRAARPCVLPCGTPNSAWGCLCGLNGLAARYPNLIFNVRGMGLYQGFSLRRESDLPRLRDIALQQENVLLLGAGQQTIRLRPMLAVDWDWVVLNTPSRRLGRATSDRSFSRNQLLDHQAVLRQPILEAVHLADEVQGMLKSQVSDVDIDLGCLIDTLAKRHFDTADFL